MMTELKNAIYEILQNEADSMPTLKLVDNTRGINGYPENMSWSIIGFESAEELEKVEQELKAMLKETVTECTDEEDREELEEMHVCRQFLHKRYGWNLWEVQTDSANCDSFDMWDIYAKSSPHYSVYAKRYWTEKEIIENEVINSGFLNDCETFEAVEEIVSKAKDLWSKIENLEDGEILVREYESETYEVVKRFVTKFSEDTDTYAIALSII